MIKTFTPGTFEPENHWYNKVQSATIHPLIVYFFGLSKEQIVERYCHLHPGVDKNFLLDLLSYQPRFYQLAGTDLLHVTTAGGTRQMVVIENNSCPSGQKSMPLLDDYDEYGGYMKFVKHTFAPALRKKRLSGGGICVLYDKNYQEASGYAHALSDFFKEDVPLVEYYNGKTDHVRWENGVLNVLIEGEWKPFRACFRYLTQKPWNRLPLHTKTLVVNPVICCLAGGRNKLVADKAYDLFNGEIAEHGLSIERPETIWDVSKDEIPFWVEKFGGKAVIKVPYSNAGQGVFTIVSTEELDRFMAQSFEYDQFIVQSLIGNFEWSSTSAKGTFYHVGTVPNQRCESFVLDFRFMIHSTPDGYRPLNLYSRRARKPLAKQLQAGQESWDFLGTNLSFKDDNDGWGSDTSRLLMMDRKGFNRLGIGFDDLVDGYIQTVLSTIAIDRMAGRLTNAKGQFRKKLFSSLNNDKTLIDELVV